MCSETGRLHRETIKRTVERVAPVIEIDATQVLSPEESDILRQQTDARIEAHKMAKEHGRNKLRELLKMSVERVTDLVEK